MAISLPDGVKITGPISANVETVLTGDALAFIAELQRRFNGRREELLAARRERQAAIDGGMTPGFLPDTAPVRAGDRTVAPAPADLNDRRVEITGPTERKMMINALNSGAKVFMADFEDALSPTWENVIDGQINCSDAVRRTIEFAESGWTSVHTERDSRHPVDPAPRLAFDGEARARSTARQISGSLFDFGLYMYPQCSELLARGSGPYFYLPKLESHLEARLWNDVFVDAQEQLGIPHGSIRATVLIETILGRWRWRRFSMKSATMPPGSTLDDGTTSLAQSRSSPGVRRCCCPIVDRSP